MFLTLMTTIYLVCGTGEMAPPAIGKDPTSLVKSLRLLIPGMSKEPIVSKSKQKT